MTVLAIGPTPGQIAWFVGAVNALLWVVLAYRVLRRGVRPMPVDVRVAAIVGSCAAAIGGFVTGLGYLGALSPDWTTMVGIGWRAAMLVAALYAHAALTRTPATPE